MRQRPAFALVLLTGLTTGCFVQEPVQKASWLRQMQASAGLTGPDVVQLDVAMIERPLGDRYINEELWSSTDEQFLALEHKALLEDNGFRIGQLGGITPAQLHTLLTSDHYCVNPRRIRVHASASTSLVLGPSLPVCSFQIQQDGQPVSVELEQAQCKLLVTPTLAKDGLTHLHFTPQIIHGESKQVIRASEDHSDWVVQTERSTQTYDALSWEVSLAPNEYLMIGGRYDRPDTLGHRCFLRGEEATPVQRLLVIRTSRSSLGVMTDGDLEDRGVERPTDQSIPLALQAGWPAVRAAAP